MKKHTINGTCGVVIITLVIVAALTGCGSSVGPFMEWDGVTTDTSWYDDGETDFSITTAAALAGLAELANGGNNFSGKTITQKVNIDLKGHDWTSIGITTDDTTWFKGVYNGNGKTISNLAIISDQDYINYVGLFGFIDFGGTVENLKLVAVNINLTGDSYCAGGVAGDNYGTIKNCSVSGFVKTYNTAGGVAGYNEGTIQYCYSTCTVEGTLSVGGVVGTNIGTVQYCYATGAVSGIISVGGVAGENSGEIKNCYATATVSGETAIGGLSGNNVFGGTVRNCYATGDVTGSEHTGGVVGYNDQSTIQNCYATGNVEGDLSTGGVVGSAYGNDTIENCVALNNSITGSTYVSRVIGHRNTSSSLDNNYGSEDIPGTWSNIGLDDYDGEDVIAADYRGANSDTWWKNTAGFPDSDWIFAKNKLPALKMNN